MPIGSGSLPWPTAAALLGTVRVCDKEGVPVKVEAPVGCSIVQWARSTIVESFLRTEFTHLFFIDADIVWHPDQFFRILGFAGVLDVVGATYPLKREAGGYLINFAGEPGKYEVNGLGCIKIESMGIGFTCIRRTVLERVASTKTRMFDLMNNLDYRDIFRVDRSVDASIGLTKPRGEDTAFFADVRELGYDVWLDPSVNLGHHGTYVYSGDVIDALGLQDYAKEMK